MRAFVTAVRALKSNGDSSRAFQQAYNADQTGAEQEQGGRLGNRNHEPIACAVKGRCWALPEAFASVDRTHQGCQRRNLGQRCSMGP